jgi:hypothetical protein
MNPKLILCLALGLFAHPVFAWVELRYVSPTNSDAPVSVHAAATDGGERFTVFYQTNVTTRDGLLRGTVDVCGEDQPIASCPVAKTWTTNGVEFEFTVSAAYLTASRFTITELSPVPGSADCYWFYLRDFATNGLSTNEGTGNPAVTPEILKALPERMQSLRPGMTANKVWNQLFHRRYEHCFAGEGSPEHERWWLTWNYEGEFYLEVPTNRPFFDEGKRKLIRAILYRNGREISRSGK